MKAMMHLSSCIIACEVMSNVTDSCQATKIHISAVNSHFLFPSQAKRRLALDDSDHQYQSEPARTPRGRGGTAVANGARLKTPRSKKLKALHPVCTCNPELYRILCWRWFHSHKAATMYSYQNKYFLWAECV